MKKVEVTWIDIVSLNGWRTQNQLDNTVLNKDEGLVNQIGYLYEEDDDQIVLLDSYFADRSMLGGVHKIPKGCVKTIKVLK